MSEPIPHQSCNGRFDVPEEFLEREPISFRDNSDMCEFVAQFIEDWPQIEHVWDSSDDGGPLISLTTMMLVAQAVD